MHQKKKKINTGKSEKTTTLGNLFAWKFVLREIVYKVQLKAVLRTRLRNAKCLLLGKRLRFP